jgi:hypothetical protein
MYDYGGAAIAQLYLDANAVGQFIYRLDGLVASAPAHKQER